MDTDWYAANFIVDFLEIWPFEDSDKATTYGELIWCSQRTMITINDKTNFKHHIHHSEAEKRDKCSAFK